MGAKEIQIDWKDLGKPQTLPSGTTYKIVVKREPIPIIFVPGIMGSRLRGADKAIWDPDAKGFMLWNYGLFFDTPRAKMEMLVGPKRLFQPGFAFPDEDDAKHNKLFKEYPGADQRGWGGVFWDSYKAVLTGLQDHPWIGKVDACFDLPVYAVGYDWRDSAQAAGRKLIERVAKIRGENPGCKKVILVTHSMGGLVARSACKDGLAGDVLAVVHTVQPVTGAAAAYWRMKAGFERAGTGLMGHVQSWVLGANGREVTALLGHMPGGLQLLPNKLYKDNQGHPGWLNYSRMGDKPVQAPSGGDPYNEIYRHQTAPFRLILWKDYLDGVHEAKPSQRDTAWRDFDMLLTAAETFHGWLADYNHPKGWHYYGAGRLTADTIKLEQGMAIHWGEQAYPGMWLRPRHLERGEFQFFDEYRVPKDDFRIPPLRPVLTMASADGDGDSTVPASSGKFLDGKGGPAIFIKDSGHDSCFKDANLVEGDKALQQPKLGIAQVIESVCLEKIDAEKHWG